MIVPYKSATELVENKHLFKIGKNQMNYDARLESI